MKPLGKSFEWDVFKMMRPCFAAPYHPHFKQVFDTLEYCQSAIMDWVRKSKMLFNPAKTEVLLLNRSQRLRLRSFWSGLHSP